jgi:hypothetical protein
MSGHDILRSYQTGNYDAIDTQAQAVPLDAEKNNIIHRIAVENNAKALDALQSNGINIRALNAKNADGNTPAHIAVMRGSKTNDYTIVKKLLILGANPNIQNNAGEIVIETETDTNSNYNSNSNPLGSSKSKSAMQDESEEEDKIDFLQKLVYYLKSKTVTGGAKSKSSTSSDDVLNADIDDSISSTNNNDVDYDENGDNDNDNDNDDNENVTEYDGGFETLYNSRIAKMNALQKMLYDERIQNEGTIYHENVVKRIQELMNVDEQTAKIYRSVLFRKISQENPTASNTERSRKMSELFDTPEKEKQTIKSLANVDVQAVKAEIDRIREEKEKNRINKPKTSKNRHRKNSSKNADNVDMDTTPTNPIVATTAPTTKSKSAKTATKKTKTKSGGDYLNTSDILLSSN